MEWGLIITLVIFVIIGAIIYEAIKRSKMTPEELIKYEESIRKEGLIIKYGEHNSQIECQMCKEKGGIYAKEIKNKKGISGGKATAAVLTLGWSMLATGLSRKEKAIHVYCDKCNMEYDF